MFASLLQPIIAAKAELRCYRWMSRSDVPDRGCTQRHELKAQRNLGQFAFAGAFSGALFVAACERSTSQAVAPREASEPLPAALAAGPKPRPDVPAQGPAAAAAGGAAVAMDHGPFQLAAACRGSCPVGLTVLDGERALALWPDADGPWAQRFDLARGSALGAPMALGELDRDDMPYVFALPDGDAALFGVLPNGRVTFARGSEVATRRVAPKVVVPRNLHAVQSLAASATSTGLVLLILREAEEKALRAADTPIDAELHWFDAQGTPLRAPLARRAAALSTEGGAARSPWHVVGAAAAAGHGPGATLRASGSRSGESA
jgi:hypothetical protein